MRNYCIGFIIFVKKIWEIYKTQILWPENQLAVMYGF